MKEKKNLDIQTNPETQNVDCIYRAKHRRLFLPMPADSSARSIALLCFSHVSYHDQHQERHDGDHRGAQRRHGARQGGVGQVGVGVRRWHLALVAVEVDLARERPALPEGEGAGVLAHEHLRLHVPVRPRLHEVVVEVLEPVEHGRVI